jgi:hypothetical protein
MTTTEVAVAERKATDVTLTGGGGNRDVYMAVADAVAPKHVQGSLLKFSKGEWLAGEKQEIVPNGTRVIAAVDQILMGWVFWEDGKPTDHRMVLVSSGEAPARRAELGDLDQSRWEKDASGELRDPWAMTFYVPMWTTPARCSRSRRRPAAARMPWPISSVTTHGTETPTPESFR